MPCRSDHMEPNLRELEGSKVTCLLAEIDGTPIKKSHWDGYHPAVYNQNFDLDEMTATLCEKLQLVDVTKYSLEMQMWWRDHQEADRLRIQNELAASIDDRDRKAALEKLTPHERELLGV